MADLSENDIRRIVKGLEITVREVITRHFVPVVADEWEHKVQDMLTTMVRNGQIKVTLEFPPDV